MKILTLDASTQSTGYAVGSYQDLQYHGCITKKSNNVKKRIIQMREQIINLICSYNPDKIVIQQVRPQTNSHTGKVLMWLQGAIVIAAYECKPNVQIEFINANEWRAAIKIHQGRGVKRNEVKIGDIQYVKEKYNIDVNDDEADAICIFDSYWVKKQDNEINWQ